MSQDIVLQADDALDPRRLFSERDRTAVRTRQRGLCGVCNDPLPVSFHMHHVVPWSRGGATLIENALAVCPRCHVAAPTASLSGITLRTWQELAAEAVTPILRARQFSLVIAAPGAGKTLFGVTMARQLAASGTIDRVVVFGPNAHLRTAWVSAFAAQGIKLDPEPRGGVERLGYKGCALTYASLSTPETVAAIQQSVENGRTLIILDEAHHLAADEDGDHRPWAFAIGKIAGSIDSPVTPVLNLTGTPFRSLQSQRIATVRYRPVDGQPDKIECAGDFEVTANSLIDDGHLRHIDLYSFDAGIEIVDLRASSTAAATSVADLGDQDRSVRSAALKHLLRDEKNYLEPQIDEMIEKLRQHQELIGSPVKGLIVADDSRHADQIYDLVRKRLGKFAMVAHSKTDDPRGDLERFRNCTSSAILVAVRMVTEGFDCPEITTIVHATRWSAPLFVNQLVARAMRVSAAERRLGLVLPATIMVPADPELVAVYSDVLVSSIRLLDVRTVCPTCNVFPCSCRALPGEKQCAACAYPWRLCVCLCDSCGARRRSCGCVIPATRLVDVTVTSNAELHAVSHDGTSVSQTLIQSIDWHRAGVPVTFIPAAAAAVQATIEATPYHLAAAIQDAERRSA